MRVPEAAVAQVDADIAELRLFDDAALVVVKAAPPSARALSTTPWRLFSIQIRRGKQKKDRRGL
ncbi:hypothetical protein [Citreimonas salinaria]|uniref:hypothetical protein n=1 Tax=Citreimonas salinaria TaxID=321339 RepID=UPI001160086D|nr:hypothetical protein [Citreimonas salinaria]